ncbi:MAG: hypothetical protein FH748_08250 [Balneolaceae bacterium]|nr:hypothetical protein [Balneolaceae bacterium]
MHTNNDDGCIRYLMKEMDPSEELEFEQKMREDENLLIEVESLRATYRKLNKLPHKNPPQHLIKEISDTAKEIQSNRQNNKKRLFTRFAGMAAAIFLTATVSGGFYYLNSNGKEIPSASSTQGTINPWVDNNEVIRYTDRLETAGAEEFNSELNKSLGKLKLVNSVTASGGSNSSILLTGSPK